MRFYVLLILLAFSISTFAQFPDTGMCTKRPIVAISATIKGFGYSKIVYTGKDSIRNGFNLVLSDPSYQIVGFRVYFFGKGMDLYWKDISGSIATEVNLPVLNNLYGDEWMEIECITVMNNKKLFTALPFKIWINP